MVDLGGYVIVLVEKGAKIKLYGSAAERSDCDEILEINGRCLENASHQQIVHYIHECIRTRTICLRVKRRAFGKLAIESSLVDAFVIGAKGREHLQQIAKNTKITPRDIAQLSRILTGESEDGDSGSGTGLRTPGGASSSAASTRVSVTVASVTSSSSSSSAKTITTQAAAAVVQKRQQQQQPKATSTASSRQQHLVQATAVAVQQQEVDRASKFASSTDQRRPHTPVDSSSSTYKVPGSQQRSSKNTDPELSTYSAASTSSQHLQGRSGDWRSSARSLRTVSSTIGAVDYYELESDPANSMELVELNRTGSASGQRQQQQSVEHRELPVDVPDTFVGVVKQHPRYPPPPPAAPPRSSSSAQQQAPEPEKLRKYQEDVTKKKAEEEFLRSSLRGSKKLQQLEKKHQDEQRGQGGSGDLRPAVNEAFEPDGGCGGGNDGQVPEHNKVLPLPDLELVVSRLAQQLNGETKEILEHSKITKLISIYKSVMQQKQHSLPSMSVPSCDLVQEIITLLQEESSLNSEAAELLEILTRFELEGLCYAFDQIMVSEKDRGTVSETEPSTTTSAFDHAHADSKNDAEVLEENLDPSVRVVRVEKSSSEPLGATVKNEPDGSVLIGRIVKGGAAEKSGLLHEGDEVLEVNGIEMKGRNVNQVCDILAEMTGTLTFVIAIRDTIKSHTPHIQQVVHLKALFDYDPDDDLYIPCRELGICFTKGDVLHVIDQHDANWWQAYREGEHDQSLAGLIPSANFQLQRETMKQSILSDSNNTAAMNYKNNRNHKKPSASSLLLNCGKRSHQRRKKRKSQLFAANEEILTYEEVSLYYPRANIKRPIVLIGPTNIGRHELRQRLMQDTERFAAAVPHTSRTRRDGENDAIDYHFISRQQFEQDIKDGKFVEHGEYEKNYYGTSLSAIEAVVQSGKICVLNLHVHSIPILRQGHAGAKLKPYFVFVAPPTQMDKLNRLISSTAQTEGNNVSMSELQAIIDEARDIESRYGHFFDMVLSIVDIDRAYQELLREINALEREPQWIPNIWMK